MPRPRRLTPAAALVLFHPYRSEAHLLLAPSPTSTSWEALQGDLPFSADQLLEALSEVRKKHALQAIYVGGSRADGFANRRSDLDVYGLVDAPLEKRQQGYEAVFLQGQHIQIELVSIPAVREATSRIKAGFELMNVDSEQIKVLHRLVSSVVLEGEKVVSDLRKLVVACDFPRYSAYRRLRSYDNALFDAYGAYDSGHAELAIYSIRTALVSAMDALLCACGETSASEKWVFHKCARALRKENPLAQEFAAIYWSMPQLQDSASLRTYFDRAVALSSRCVDLVSWDRMSTQFDAGIREQFAELLSAYAGDAKCSAHVALRIEHGKPWLYASGWPKQELSPRVAALWVLLARGLSPEMARGLFASTESFNETLQRVQTNWQQKGYLRDGCAS